MAGELGSTEAQILGVKLGVVKDGLDEVKLTLTEVNDTLKSLVRVEGRLDQHALDLQQAHDWLKDHEKRLQPLERHMPVVLETRGWVIAGVLAVFAFFGYLVLGGAVGLKPTSMPIPKVAP